MTKIKLLNDRIIFDGHADSRQECETITLMCDNLAKSKDFKTVRYESGYAEFEKVGKTDELKFPPYSQNVNFIFDSTISSILLTAGSTNTDNSLPATITESGGSSVRFGSAISGEPTTTTTICTLTIADGYELDTINVTVSDESLGSASNFIISNKTSTGFTFYSSAEDTTWYTVTLTTKAIVQKQTIDVSTLTGWANLATGNHQITVKTKASGYADSAASNAVTVAKATSGYNVTLVYQQNDAPSDADSGSIHYPTVTYSANGETAKHTLTSAGATLQNCNSLSYEAPTVDPGSSYDSGFDITLSDVVVTVNGVTATGYQINITQDTTIIFNVYPCYAVVSGDIPCVPKCCFVAGTKVKTPNGEQAIETLKAGGYITTYNEEAKQHEPNKVLRKLINRNVTELATLKLSNGETLQFNAYHPLLTENGYKSLTCHNDLPLLTKEDKLIGGITIEEIVVENLEEPIAAYNLLVENNNNFITNGVIALGKDD